MAFAVRVDVVSPGKYTLPNGMAIPIPIGGVRGLVMRNKFGFTERLPLLECLYRVGLLSEVPTVEPPVGQVLSSCPCPLHGGDNPNGLRIYSDGWRCHKDCHKADGVNGSLSGLIRALVKIAGGGLLPFGQAMQWLNNHIDTVKVFIPGGRSRSKKPPRATFTADALAECLTIPSEIYTRRGFRLDTLAEYGVGESIGYLPDGKNLPGWTVFPCYDIRGTTSYLVGYTARNPGERGPKWWHAVDKSTTLFNYDRAYWLAGPLVVCEGPGDCLRLIEAGYPRSVATLGSQVTEDQIDKLRDAVGAVRTPVVVLAADNDDAGRACVEKLTGALRGYCEVRVAYPPAGCKDFGEMRPEDVARVIKEAVDMDTLDDENAWKRAEALARANPYPKISHGGMLIWPTVSLAWHLSRLYGGGVFPLPAHKLAAKFEAHPFMVEKCLKEMVDEGYVVADGDGYRWTGFRPKLDVHHVAELRGCSPEAVVQAALAYGIHKAEGRKVTREEMSKLSGKAEVVGPELVAAYLTGQPQPEVNWPTVRTDDLEIAALLRQAGFVLEPDGLSVKLFPFEDWWAVRRSVFAAACKGLEVMVDSPF